MTGIYHLAGGETRTPGAYHLQKNQGRRADYLTNEYIHASVRARIGLRGPGIEDEGTYQCMALRGWQNVVRRYEEDGQMRREVLWEKRSDEHGAPGLVLPEDTLGDLERELLNVSPEVREKVLGSGRHGKNGRG